MLAMRWTCGGSFSEHTLLLGALLAEYYPRHERAAAIVFRCWVAVGVCGAIVADLGYVVRQDLAATAAFPVTFHGGAR